MTSRRARRATFAVWCVGVFAALAVVGPFLAPRDPQRIDLLHEFEPPSAAHWLGTCDNGVDLLSALLHGARLAGVVAALVVLSSLAIGTLLGALAGYRGGALDHAVMGLADLIQAFPSVVLNVAILAVVARPGLAHITAALVVTGWVLYARVARAQAMSLREREYVTAARALGYSDARILLRHVLPNLAGPLVVQATSGLGSAIVAESTLSFLGLGSGKSVSWGALLDQGSAVLLRAPHVAIVSGAAIAASVLAFNLAGDWLRDRLDPRT